MSNKMAFLFIENLLPVRFCPVKVEALLFERSQVDVSIAKLFFSSAHRYTEKSLEITLFWPLIKANFAVFSFGSDASSI